MPEWWTYRLEDFVMFSSRTYYRTLELYNGRLWPLHLLAIAAGVAILMLRRRREPRRGQLTAGLLAIMWAWVGWGYFLRYHATINWAARYFALAFLLQALLLMWEGVARRRLTFGRPRDARELAGLGMFVFALAVEPAIGPLVGRDWRQLELFGLAPDPTAIGTLGVLLSSSGRPPWRLLAIPGVWCAISGATLWVLESKDAAVAPAAAAVAILIAAARPRAGRQQA